MARKVAAKKSSNSKTKRNVKVPSTASEEPPQVSADVAIDTPAERVEGQAEALSSAPVIVLQEGTSLGDSLFTTLVGGASPDCVATDILRIYAENNAAEVCCALLNLVGKASGVVHGELDPSALGDNVDMNALLEEMFARIPPNAPPYLYAQKDPKSEAIRTAFTQFFTRLVELSYNTGVMQDGFLIPNTVAWLVAMGESKARCFRHTSTAVLLCVVDALSGVVQDCNRQLRSTKRSKKQEAAQESAIESIVELRNQILSQSIHQRARDVAPEIRLLVFEKLGGWMIKYDEEFAENKYFRYFGMALYDKKTEIRVAALGIIQRAIDTITDSGSRMFLFLQYFAKRFVEMCNDVSTRCAELAISVIRRILSAYANEVEEKQCLSPEMVDCALLSIFDERPTIRHEAGALLREFIETRLPAEERSQEDGQAAMTELLCTYAVTLRSHYGEAMPERYIVDSLYTPTKDIPPLLHEYRPMLKFAKSGDVNETIVGLSLVAAVLEKIQGRMDLGPTPRDDRKQPHEKKLKANMRETLETFVASLSRDVGGLLINTLEAHRGDADVVGAVASVIAVLNMKAFTSLDQMSGITSVLMMMRKLTATLPYCSENIIAQIAAGWQALLADDHPLAKEANGQVLELQRQVLKQLATGGKKASQSLSAKSEKEQLSVWCRMCILSSIISIVDQWELLKSSFLDHVKRHSSPQLIQLILMAWGRCVLWQLREMREQQKLSSAEEGDSEEVSSPNTSHDIRQMIGEILPCVFQMWAAYSKDEDESNVKLLVDSMLLLCDLCALPHYTLSQIEQDSLLENFAELSAILAPKVIIAQDACKAVEANVSEEQRLSNLAKRRREASHLESSLMRITMGMARLLVLNRLPEDNAARLLVQWARSPTKTVSDVFRCLFRKLRDLSGDSFLLEKSILMVAYNTSPEALSTMGMKLSSMHWPLHDKHYSACVDIVRFGIEFAISTDTSIITAVLPYCSKLLRNDALTLANSVACCDELITSKDPTMMTFVSSLFRVARLEGPASLAFVNKAKRMREVSASLDLRTGYTQDQTLQPSSRLRSDVVSTPQRPQRVLRNIRQSDTLSLGDESHQQTQHEGFENSPEEIVDGSLAETGGSFEGSSRLTDTPGANKSGARSLREPLAPFTGMQKRDLSAYGDTLNSDEIFIATMDFE
uniref:SCD domain-containing protein n=1 Tax=Trypanosoma congolense (strain IL3000) TaxID=1068625 RepID=G0UWH7_TRYCI|nr:conserved hypothetical protein [Trypanosoma congolense IL3000]